MIDEDENEISRILSINKHFTRETASLYVEWRKQEEKGRRFSWLSWVSFIDVPVIAILLTGLGPHEGGMAVFVMAFLTGNVWRFLVLGSWPWDQVKLNQKAICEARQRFEASAARDESERDKAIAEESHRMAERHAKRQASLTYRNPWRSLAKRLRREEESSN